MKKNKVVKCGGIIIDHKSLNILCILNRSSHKKGENKWGLPKGHLNKNESYIKCAQREVLEETGIYFKINKFNYNKSIKLNNCIYFIINHSDKSNDYKSLDNNEVFLVKWISYKELCSLNKNRDLNKITEILGIKK